MNDVDCRQKKKSAVPKERQTAIAKERWNVERAETGGREVLKGDPGVGRGFKSSHEQSSPIEFKWRYAIWAQLSTEGHPAL